MKVSMNSQSKPNLRIDPATEADIPLILSLIRELARYERMTDEVATTEQSLLENLFGARRYAEVVIARLDDRPVGYALFFHNYSSFAGKPGLYLEDVFVLPEFRGEGIGKALLFYLARLAVERKCGRFEWMVLDWNMPAIDFYRKLGAVSMDSWRLFRLSGDALARLADRDVR
jgi:GNAT superfamily N-acetyltransferase